MKNDSFNLNKLYALPVAMVCLSGVFASCKEEAEGRITIDDTPPQQVTNVKYSSGPGEVYLSWMNPDTLSNPSFMYTKVEYLDEKGEIKYHLISKERAVDNIVEDTIRGFATMDAKTFSLYTCTVRGYHGDAVDVSVSPNAPAFMELVHTVQLQPDLGGIIVSWNNVYDVPINIVLDYHAAADSGKSGKMIVNVEGKGEGSQFVSLLYGDNMVLSGEECVVNVSGQDEAENSSESVEFRITPKAVSMIDRSGWSFPGYLEDSNSGTIGYSSQETSGEGGGKVPHGRVIAMLDGDLSTYWHASWKQSSKYPHWFIVDMGKDITVSTVEITRRQGDGRGQKGQRFYTCSSADATDLSNPDNWNWTDHGNYSFDISSDAPQIFRLSSNPVCRYIKVYFGEEHKGSADQAMVSEFNVYGAE